MSWIDWIWLNIAPDVRARKHLDGPRSVEEAAANWTAEGARMKDYLPLAQMPQLRDVAPFYYDWLGHPAPDPWWNWADLRDKYARNHAAVLNLSGWYDDNYGPEGAITNYLGLRRSRPRAPADTALLLGPWVHGVSSTATPKSGERSFPGNAAIDYDEIVLAWMDHYLRGIDNGVDRAKPVRYYVMGTNEWRESAAWPPPARATAFYLNPGDAGPGVLSPVKPRAALREASFVSDPDDPVRNAYEASGAHDYRQLATRADVLTFDTPPLARDTEVTGPIRAQLYVSCDCRDFDLWVRLLDKDPDGTVYNLMSPGLDVQRASYRDMRHGRQWLEPGKVYAIELPNLLTSNTFLKGHQIRVQVMASFHPNFSRNLQSGENEVLSRASRKATIHLYADRQRPSNIVLPVAGH